MNKLWIGLSFILLALLIYFIGFLTYGYSNEDYFGEALIILNVCGFLGIIGLILLTIHFISRKTK